MERYDEYMSLEREFNDINNKVNAVLARTEGYIVLIEHIYKDSDKKDEDFVAEMHITQANLLRLINKLNDIAMKAMAENNKTVYYKCEDVKLRVRSTMEVVRNLYM
jgi:hypothetical protein